MERSHRFFFARDALVATAVIAGLYGLAMGSPSAPLQIPGYLIIVSFDVLELMFGPASNYRVLFAVYLLGLGLLSAVVAHSIRVSRLSAEISSWRLGIAGAFTVLGVVSLAFAVSVFLGTSQRRPVLITGVVGLSMLVLAAWLANTFDIER